MTDFATDSILVLLDVTASGGLAKSAAGLLGAASTVGTPVARIVADGADALAQEAADLGAAAVLDAASPEGMTSTRTRMESAG